MNTQLRRGMLALPAVASLSIAAAHAQTAIVPIGTLGGEYAVVNAVNDRGQVVGYSSLPTFEFHAFLWENGVLHDLGGGTFGYAADINDRGQIVGSTTDAAGASRAVVWEDRQEIVLPSLPGSEYCTANAINGRGLIAGSCTLGPESGFQTVGVLWRDGVAERMHTSGVSFAPIDVNDREVVVGHAYPAPGLMVPVVWKGGVMVELETIAGRRFDTVVAINRRGQIVGFAVNAAGVNQGLFFDGRTTIDVPTLPGVAGGVPYDVNNHGDVTGLSGRGFVWTRGRLITLSPLPEGGPAYGTAINDHGDVAGNATVSPDAIYPTAVFWPRATRGR